MKLTKPMSLAHTLAKLLFALLLTALPSARGGITVTSVVTPSPVNACSATFNLSTTITWDNTGANYFYLQIPNGCDISYDPLQPCIQSLDVDPPAVTCPNSSGVRSVRISVFTTLPCTIDGEVTIPCDAKPDANGIFAITYPTPSAYFPAICGNADTAHAQNPALTAADVPFQVIKPEMMIGDFSDENGAPVGANGPNPPPQLLNVGPGSPPHYREFYLTVTEETIEAFTFNYSARSQITPIKFDFEAIDANGTTVGLPELNDPVSSSFRFDQARISKLFTGSTTAGHLMTLGERIRVREYFSVVHCSPSPNIGTVYTVTWDCPTAAATTCNTDTATRFILTETSDNSITPSYTLTPDLAFCSLLPSSDLVVTFANAPFDTYATHPQDNKIFGSSTKTLDVITFPLKIEDLGIPALPPAGKVFLEGSGSSASIDVTTLPGFYSYSGGRVVLNFNLLTTQALGATGPLEDGFIPNGIFNELVDGQSFSIRFDGVGFECRSSGTYQPLYATADFPGGFGFADWPKPAPAFLFFGDGGANSYFDIKYFDMCQAPHQEQPNANLRNQAEVSTLIESSVPVRPGQIDIFPGDDGVVDFRYISPSYPGPVPLPPSPFSFSGPLSGTPYFKCAQTDYRILLDVPDFYDVTSVDYYPDPNSTANVKIYVTAGTPDLTTTFPLPAGTDNNGSLVLGGKIQYVLANSFLGFNGRLVIHVVLARCPPNPRNPLIDPPYGGYDSVTARIQAICDGCVDCAYTTVCLSGGFYRHCKGPCVDPGETAPPQSTTSYSVQRVSLGTRESNHTQPVVLGVDDVSLGLGYPCDVFEVNATGSIEPRAGNQLAFRFKYGSAPSVNYQFFDYVLGTGSLVYNDGSGDVTLPIVPGDLSTVFPPPGAPPCTIGWDGCAATPVNTLYVNLKDPTLVGLMQSGSSTISLTLKMRIKVKPLTGAGAPAPGKYVLTPLEGQFWGGAGAGQASCDPYNADLTVLNVQTVYNCAILPGNYANQQLGWPYATGVCERRFFLITSVVGGAFGHNEFKNEYRAVDNWNNLGNPISMTLPPGVYLTSADFAVLQRTPFYCVDFTRSGSVPAGQTVTFNGYYATACSGPVLPWEVPDRDGLSTDLILKGTVTSHCPATQADPITGLTQFMFPFFSQEYSTGPEGCRQQHLPINDPLGLGDQRSFPSTSPDPVISLTAAVTPLHITSASPTVTGLKYSLVAWPGATIDHAFIKVPVAPLTSPNFLITTVSVTQGTTTTTATPDVNGYVQLGSIPSGLSNPAHLALGGVLIGCQPGQVIPITIEYGYACDGYPGDASSIPGMPTVTACTPLLYTFDVVVDESDMAMQVFQIPATDPLVPQPICPCENFYRVRLSSIDAAAVPDPGLAITVPPGMRISSAAYQTSAYNAAGQLVHSSKTFWGCSHQPTAFPDKVTFNGIGTVLPTPTATSPTLYFWDVDADVYSGNGMPPGVAYVDLIIGIQGCAANPTFKFHPSGFNLCGGAIPPSPGFADVIDTYPIAKDTVAPVFSGCPTAPLILPCNTPPTCAMASSLGITANDACTGPIPTTCLPGPITANGCQRSQVFTLTATDPCGNAATCQVTYHWIEDLTGPSLTVPTTGLNLGCNPATLPTDASVTAASSATDTCGATTITVTHTESTTGCVTTRDFTVTAKDACKNATVQHVIYTWTTDPTSPVLTVPTTGLDLGCAPISLPDDSSVAAASSATDACGATTISVTHAADSTVNGVTTRDFTVTAKDPCLNITVLHVVYTWKANCATNCCDNCVAGPNGQYPATYTVTVYPGYNQLVNHLCHGSGNFVESVLLNAPNGIPEDSVVYLWDKATQAYVAPNFYSLGSWSDPSMTLEPGTGFLLFNPTPTPYQLTFTGCEPTNCPAPCEPTNGYWLVGRIGTGNPTSYSDLFSCPPECGTQVSIFDPVTQSFRSFDFVNGVWTPQPPSFGVGQSAFVTVLDNTNCCCKVCLPGPNGQYPASYTVTVYPGFNALVNQLCRGTNNLLTEVLGNDPSGGIPADTQVIQWNETTQTYGSVDVFDGTDWIDNATGNSTTTILKPGDGFMLFNPGPAYQLTFSGCEPACAPPCGPTNGMWLVGRIGTGSPSYYTNLFSCPPKCGTRMSVFNPQTQIYDRYDYVNGVWTPPEPGLLPGQAASFEVLPNTNCCRITCANDKTVACGQPWHFDPPTASSGCCSNLTFSLVSSNVVNNNPCQTVFNGVWQAIDCDQHITTCTQAVTMVDLTPPVLTCPKSINRTICGDRVRVFFQTKAVDACDPSVTVSYSPASGSFFNVGTTTVTCTGTDDCGNTATCSFPVTVVDQSFWQWFPAGVPDCYAWPYEPSYRGPCLNNAYPTAAWKGFDDPTVNRPFGHTWNLPPFVTYLDGKLFASMKDYNCQGGSLDDRIRLGLNGCTPGSPWAWTRRLGSPLGLYPANWCNLSGCNWLFQLPLNALPQASGSPINVMPNINAPAGGAPWARRLDLLVEDDTRVDFAWLVLRRCAPNYILGGLGLNLTNAQLVYGPENWTLLKDPASTNGFTGTFELGAVNGVKLNFDSLGLARTPGHAGSLRILTTTDDRMVASQDELIVASLVINNDETAILRSGQPLPGGSNLVVRRFSNDVLVASNTVPATMETELASFQATARVQSILVGKGGEMVCRLFDSSRQEKITLQWFPAIPLTGAPQLSSLTLAAENFDAITLDQPELRWWVTLDPELPEWSTTTSGAATAQVQDGQLTLSALNPNSTDAMAFDLTFGRGLTNEFRATMPTSFGQLSPRPAQASLNVGCNYDSTSVNDIRRVGVSFASTSGENWSVTAFGTEAGNSTGSPRPVRRVVVLNNGVEVANVDNPGSVIVSALPNIYWPGKPTGVDQGLLHRFPYSSTVIVEINGAVHAGNELRVLIDTDTPVARFAGLHVETVGAEALMLSHLETGPITDTDGDGLPDAWELAHGLNPNDASDADEDADGDGLTNLQEFLEHSDPLRPEPLRILEQPTAQTIPEGEEATFTVVATGAPPLRYQWRKNGTEILGATDATLTLTSVSLFDHASTFDVVVQDSNGSLTSVGVTLTVQPDITSPQLISATGDASLTRITLQFNERLDPGSALDLFSYTVSGGLEVLNVSLGTDGMSVILETTSQVENTTYTVTTSDIRDLAGNSLLPNPSSASFRSISTRPSTPPTIIVHPASQDIVIHGNVTLSVTVDTKATLPLGYLWRRNNSPVEFQSLSNHVSFLTITNLLINDTYRVAVTNLARPGGILSSPALITVLPDLDHDGLPDSWEVRHFGSATGASPEVDTDGDGMTNRQEYEAGTDPTDARSFLSAMVPPRGSTATLQFEAVAGKTYSIQSAEVLNGTAWTKRMDVPAHPTNRVVILPDESRSAAKRFYRVTTPRQPQ